MERFLFILFLMTLFLFVIAVSAFNRTDMTLHERRLGLNIPTLNSIAPEAHCVSSNFNMENYMKKVINKRDSVKGISFWQKQNIRRHSWASIGNIDNFLGENCMNSEDGFHHGCAPFQDLTTKLKKFKSCLKNSEMPMKMAIAVFFQRLNRLASKSNAVERFEKESELYGYSVKKCFQDHSINHYDFQCLPVLMGSPGYYAIEKEATLADHGDFQNEIFWDPTLVKQRIKTCKVLPVCGRLAMQKMTHFQSMLFDQSVIDIINKGLFEVSLTNYDKLWIQIDDGNTKKFVHQICSLKPEILGKTICWSVTACINQMLKFICKEHAECCPNYETHLKCNEDLTSNDCNICKQSNP